MPEYKASLAFILIGVICLFLQILNFFAFSDVQVSSILFDLIIKSPYIWLAVLFFYLGWRKRKDTKSYFLNNLILIAIFVIVIFFIFSYDVYKKANWKISLDQQKFELDYDLMLAEKEGNPQKYSLIIASAEGDIDAVKELIKSGTDVNLKDYGGKTALMYAVLNSHIEIMEELINAGAKVNIKDNTGYTPLRYAKHSNSDSPEKIIEILKNADAEE